VKPEQYNALFRTFQSGLAVAEFDRKFIHRIVVATHICHIDVRPIHSFFSSSGEIDPATLHPGGPPLEIRHQGRKWALIDLNTCNVSRSREDL